MNRKTLTPFADEFLQRKNVMEKHTPFPQWRGELLKIKHELIKEAKLEKLNV